MTYPARFAICLALLLTPLLLHAQPRLEPTLLWEISGNGLQKPSYIYGTIHVHDSKAFRLNDSVLAALRSCSIFASELQFDTLVRHFVTEYIIPRDGLAKLRRLQTGSLFSSD